MSALRLLLACLAVAVLAGCPGSLVPPDSKQAQENPPAAAPGDANPAPTQPRENVFQRVVELVDRNKYMAEHPTAIELEANRINAGGYLQAVSQGYFAAASTATIANFEHDLQIQKELNGGKWPTFDKYKEILDTHGVQLKGLRLNQVYAYNDQNGQMTILELPQAPQP